MTRMPRCALVAPAESLRGLPIRLSLAPDRSQEPCIFFKLTARSHCGNRRQCCC